MALPTLTRGRWLFAVPVWALALSAGACGDDDSTCTTACNTPEPTTVMMVYEGRSGFFDAPFPSNARLSASSRPDIEGFPNPQNIVLVNRVLEVLRSDADGFGTSSGVFFRASKGVDPTSLPTLTESAEAGASVYLIGVDESSPDYLVRYPVDVSVEPKAGLYGAENLIALVPLQGIPLRPLTRYAAVITTKVLDVDGAPLAAGDTMQALVNGERPAGMSEAAFNDHRAALTSLEELSLEEAGAASGSVVGLTVFTTGDPISTLERGIEAARAIVPSPKEAFVKTDDFPTFCVYRSTIDMPDYQAGEPPFLEEGGGFVLDETGTPVWQRNETARIFVTVPKSAMPANGYPIVVFSRTGGGGDRPLIDRGVRAEPGGEAVEPGTGPALDLASAGFAGISIDGPHGGLRNITQSDEQFLVFNFQNPLALRDNVRQSALEIAITPDIVANVAFDVSDCAGAIAPNDQAIFDTDTMAVMGHSMGAAISPLSLVFEPRFKAILLSGAGGSFLANMLYKQKPLAVKPLAEIILGITGAGYELTAHDPMLSMLQWAGEAADAPIYGRYIVEEPRVGGPRHVLMMQGIVDHYIMPPIANATSLSFGLDLAGEAIDGDVDELAALTPLAELLPLAGGESIGLPASANATSLDGDAVTAVVVQFPEDGIEDGHEVMFQTEPPKHAYRCFLQGLVTGGPRVPSNGNIGAACD